MVRIVARMSVARENVHGLGCDSSSCHRSRRSGSRSDDVIAVVVMAGADSAVVFLGMCYNVFATDDYVVYVRGVQRKTLKCGGDGAKREHVRITDESRFDFSFSSIAFFTTFMYDNST
jgi:hypothetical protein